MTKICLIINKLSELELDCNSIIVGLKNFNSLNTIELDYQELKEIINNYPNKEIFISINKTIHDNEIDELKNILIKLNNLNLAGIVFDDVGFYNVVKKLNINISLIWGNIHQATNYITINEWNKLGVTKAIISPEITVREIFEIQNNTTSKLFIPIYGMYEIFNSNRFLLTNYLRYINNTKNDDIYYIENNNTKYPIYENKIGTHIIDGKVLNGIAELQNLNVNRDDYLLINTYMLNNVDEVIDAVKNRKSINLNENEYDGFLNKETFYKVKSDNNERK